MLPVRKLSAFAVLALFTTSEAYSIEPFYDRDLSASQSSARTPEQSADRDEYQRNNLSEAGYLLPDSGSPAGSTAIDSDAIAPDADPNPSAHTAVESAMPTAAESSTAADSDETTPSATASSLTETLALDTVPNPVAGAAAPAMPGAAELSTVVVPASAAPPPPVATPAPAPSISMAGGDYGNWSLNASLRGVYVAWLPNGLAINGRRVGKITVTTLGDQALELRFHDMTLMLIGQNQNGNDQITLWGIPTSYSIDLVNNNGGWVWCISFTLPGPLWTQRIFLQRQE